jgi:hypothetical protein
MRNARNRITRRLEESGLTVEELFYVRAYVPISFLWTGTPMNFLFLDWCVFVCGYFCVLHVFVCVLCALCVLCGCVVQTTSLCAKTLYILCALSTVHYVHKCTHTNTHSMYTNVYTSSYTKKLIGTQVYTHKNLKVHKCTHTRTYRYASLYNHVLIGTQVYTHKYS